MTEIIISSSDFRTPTGEVDFWDELLSSLGVPEDQRDHISYVTLQVESYETDE